MSKEFDFLKNVRKWRKMKKRMQSDKNNAISLMDCVTSSEIEGLLDALCTDLETAKTEYGSMKATAEKYQVMYNELDYKKNPPIDPDGPIVLIEYESPEARHVVVECPECHNRFYPNDIISSYSGNAYNRYNGRTINSKDDVVFYGRDYLNIYDSYFTCPICGKEMSGYCSSLIETDWDEMKKGLKTKKEITTVTWEDNE